MSPLARQACSAAAYQASAASKWLRKRYTSPRKACKQDDRPTLPAAKHRSSWRRYPCGLIASRFPHVLDRLGGFIKCLRGEPVIDRFVKILFGVKIFGGAAMTNVQTDRIEFGLLAQKIVEEMMIAIVLLAQRDDKRSSSRNRLSSVIPSVKLVTHHMRLASIRAGQPSLAGNPLLHATGDPAHRAPDNRTAHSAKSGRAPTDRARFRRVAAQTLPDQMQGDRPTFGFVGQHRNISGRQLHRYVCGTGLRFRRTKGQIGAMISSTSPFARHAINCGVLSTWRPVRMTCRLGGTYAEVAQPAH